jgi:excinuclease ABC subunit A
VFVDERTLPSITDMAVGEAELYFERLQLEGRKGEIADKILKELRARYRFLVDVGLNYLTLNRSAGLPDRRRAGGCHVHPGRTLHRTAPA